MSFEMEAKVGGSVAGVIRGGVAEYVELLKFRLVSLVLVTTAVGFYLGYRGPVDTAFFISMTHAVFGAALLGGGAMVLNQLMEREADGRMHRTQGRPLPSGRVTPVETLLYGLILSVLGLVYMFTLCPPVAAVLGALTLGSYLLLYTPLKTRTPLCTIAGAIPGAIPPAMGYVAAGGMLNAEAYILFTILFLWQMPHFLAIAWLYREDYARGGMMMLPVVDPSGFQTSRHMITFAAALIPVTLMPTLLGMTGLTYFCGALLLGLMFLGCGVVVAMKKTDGAARQMFFASIVYLPVLLVLMAMDKLPAW